MGWLTIYKIEGGGLDIIMGLHSTLAISMSTFTSENSWDRPSMKNMMIQDISRQSSPIEKKMSL